MIAGMKGKNLSRPQTAVKIALLRHNSNALLDAHWISGNMIFSEWLLTGTTPDGVPVRVRGCDHYEFRNGKVIRKDAYWKIVEKPR